MRTFRNTLLDTRDVLYFKITTVRIKNIFFSRGRYRFRLKYYIGINFCPRGTTVRLRLVSVV